jgi:predicted ABC-type ATPase
MRELVRSRASFAFETTLASRTFAPWLAELRRAGWRAHLSFLALPSADLAVARVRERVRLGGHDVPEAVIRRRFTAGLRNLFALYLPAVDTWQVLDNSELLGPRLIASGRAGREPEIADRDAWRHLEEMQR